MMIQRLTRQNGHRYTQWGSLTVPPSRSITTTGSTGSLLGPGALFAGASYVPGAVDAVLYVPGATAGQCYVPGLSDGTTYVYGVTQ